MALVMMVTMVVGVAADHVPSRQMWHMTGLFGDECVWGVGGGVPLVGGGRG